MQVLVEPGFDTAHGFRAKAVAVLADDGSSRAVGQGRGSVDAALLLARKQPCPKENLIPFQLVTLENLSSFLK